MYHSQVTVDLSVGYDVSNNLTLILGGSNIFDIYPDEQDTETETGGLWDAVQMGFSGRFLYGRVLVNL